MYHPPTESLEPISLLKAAADPVRLNILTILADHEEHTCSDIADSLNIPLSTLSHHLRILREAGFTQGRKESTTRYTSLRCDDLNQRFPGLLPLLKEFGRDETQQK